MKTLRITPIYKQRENFRSMRYVTVSKIEAVSNRVHRCNECLQYIPAGVRHYLNFNQRMHVSCLDDPIEKLSKECKKNRVW